jgi:PAS domain S-box-containing protein
LNLLQSSQIDKTFHPVVSCLAGCFAIALITFVCLQLQLTLPTPTSLYFLVIVVVSARGGFFSSAIVSVMAVICLDYYFVNPPFTFRLRGPANYIALLSFLSTSAIVSHLVTRVRQSEGLAEKANVLDLTHDTIFLRDMNNVITYWNRGAQELYGWTADEAVGKTTHQLLQTVFPAPLEEIEATLLRTDRWEGELRHTKADGTSVIVASRWSVQRDERHKPIAILELNNDMTHRRRAEDALRRQANLLEQTHDAIIVWEFRKNIIFWNQAAENLYGYSREEAIGRTSHELLQTEHPIPTWLFETLLQREGHWNGELTHTARDGRKILVESRHVMVREPEGRTLIFETNRDITERRRTQESLQQAQANLARVNRVMLVGEMTASIAHEVNQPIAAVVTSAGACLRWLAAEPPDMERAGQALERIVRDGSRAGEVIGRVRALVKKVPPSTNVFNLNEAILEVIALAQSELQKHPLELHTDLSDDMPLVSADRVQLQQVILNLIVNAIDAMSSVNDRARELMVSSGQSGPNEVFVEVRDSGQGFDQANANQLFDSFYSTKPEGIGMGLSISRSIVEAHGGRLWATANEPYGAVFRLVLPLNDDQNG